MAISGQNPSYKDSKTPETSCFEPETATRPSSAQPQTAHGVLQASHLTELARGDQLLEAHHVLVQFASQRLLLPSELKAKRC